jgi:undecaprenyl pyrophosphate phosphatase UppP
MLREDCKAQISAELIIIMAAVLAVAMIFVTNMTSTAKDSTELMNKKAKTVLDKIKKTG